MNKRSYNFSAGPATLPEAVLEEAQRDMLCLPGVGASVLEISHRSAAFGEILETTIENIRQLYKVPENYKIMFLQGGSRLQFSMIPMNLMTPEKMSADYFVTGTWSEKGAEEAGKIGQARIVYNGKSSNYAQLPATNSNELTLDKNAAYAYYVSNETIQGVQFHEEPATGGVPLVCDASSDVFHRPLEISKYGLLYACAQKNGGPAGVTLVIMREDLLARSRVELPGYMSFMNHAKANSLYNTAPTFGIYMMGLVTKWLLQKMGGLDSMFKQNKLKSKMLYETIDSSAGFYTGHAVAENRSYMNVPFRLPSEELTEKFVTKAKEAAMTDLKGHRSVGGIRASIYNAMPVAGVEKLRDFMLQFQADHA